MRPARIPDAATLLPFSRSAESTLALGRGPPRSWSDLVVAATRLGSALDAAGWRSPVVCCADRFFMLASLVSCWAGGRSAILPPNGRPSSVQALVDSSVADGVLHDGGLTGGLDVAAALDRDPGESPGPAAFGRVVDLFNLRGGEPLVTLYSSGSTGDPVACRKSARQLLGEAHVIATTFGVGPEARVLATAPPHHIYGLLFGILVPTLAGASFVRQTPLHAEAIAELAASLAANVLCAVPPHLHGLQVLSPSALSSIDKVFSSGARLPTETAAMVSARFALRVTEVLGSSETGGIGWRVAGGPAEWTPFAGVKVSATADGLLLLDSPFLDGDSPRPFRGADRVELAADGRFRHLGRADAVVKIGGERVSLAEIERRLLAVDGVRDAAILVRDEPGIRQHELCAAVVAPGLSPTSVRRALSSWLEPVAIPRRLVMVDRLPREDTGKLQRTKLAALFEDQTFAAGDGVAGGVEIA